MQAKLEFIDDYSSLFTQVGKHDEDELNTLGERSDRNVSLDLDALPCLRFFPYVTNLILRPGHINKDCLQYLYCAPIKRLKLDYYSDSLDEYTIDLSQFSKLECVFSRTEFNFRNVSKSRGLRSLVVQEWYTSDLQRVCHDKLSKLKIMSGKLKSLDGIHQLHELKLLSISNQRLLTSISGIENCFNLESLEIESCGRLNSSQIPTMPRLRSLVIIGHQTIENCMFFLRFPNLERLILGIRIIDGDISYLLNLRHCSIITDYRHYSHKNADLPKLIEDV